MKRDTLPARLAALAQTYGDRKVALREKEFGIWQQVTWRQYLDQVKACSLGLVALGLERQDKVAIISGNSPEWLYAELGAQAAGGIIVGVYPDSLPDQVQYAINHADAPFVVCEDQEQTDKVLEVRDQLPTLRHIIVDDMKGMNDYDDPMIISFVDLQKRGRQLDAQQPSLFEANLARGQADDIAMFCFTSGTTGAPKAAMLSHANGIFMAERFMQVDEVTDTDELVSFLPFAWVGEQITAVFVALTTGCTVNFPESAAVLQQDLREIGPHVMFAPPRVWEQICSDYQVKIADSSWLKRHLAQLCMAIGSRVADRKLARQPMSPLLKLQYGLAHLLLFRTLKDRFGLTNLRHVYTGGAPLGPEIFKFFQMIGVNIRQIYGQTEVSGISVLHRADDIKLDTVGKPIPETEIRISADGEILTRNRGVFQGYYKNPAATNTAIQDGWLYSGDAGWIDEDGHLVMLDRMKDVMQLADGSKFSPQLIENKLKFSPYIRESIAIGKDRPFVVALIQIDLENAGKWAEEHRLPYTTFKDLSQKPEIKDLIATEVERVNSEVPRPARIRQFALLEKELDADDDELTRTQKVRRGLVHDKYQASIEALYQAGTVRT